MFKRITGSYSSTAKVVDGTLVMSCPDAVSPVVWRMDLTYVRASALEVRENKEGQYVLVLKTPKEDLQDIAPFATRAQAVKALMAVSRAMGGAHGQLSRTAGQVSGDGVAVSKRKGNGGKWMAAAAAVILLFGLLATIIQQTPEAAYFPTTGPNGQAMAEDAFSPAVNQTGVPLSADDFLRAR